MRHATSADGQYNMRCEVSSGNGPFRQHKKVSCARSMSETYCCISVCGLVSCGVDLRAHALWYLVLVVVFVVMVMALLRGGDGGDGRWRA